MDKRERLFLMLIGILCLIFVVLEVLYYYLHFH